MRPAGIIFGASNILGIRYKISANIDNLFFFFKSTIYYMAHSGRLWQLLCNYIQEKQTNRRTKTEKEKKKEK